MRTAWIGRQKLDEDNLEEDSLGEDSIPNVQNDALYKRFPGPNEPFLFLSQRVLSFDPSLDTTIDTKRTIWTTPLSTICRASYETRSGVWSSIHQKASPSLLRTGQLSSLHLTR